MQTEERRPAKASDVDRFIGARLREVRQARSWSLAELSGRLAPPITWQQLQKYETGRNRLSSARLWEIAQLLGEPVAAFLPGSDPPAAPGPWCSASERTAIEAFRHLPKSCQQAVRVLIDALAVDRGVT